MDLKIFDVEHGSCSLLTCDDNTRLMLDCGHNGTTGWRPGQYLRGQGVSHLDMLAVTNYDEDHVSGIIDLTENVGIGWLWRNVGVETKHLKDIKAEDAMGVGIEHLCNLIENVFTGSGTNYPSFSGLTRTSFYHSYPTFEDENNLSMVVLLECHGKGVLFTGDLEYEGWIEMLKRTDFVEALRETRVLIAPHHGRESGCCEEAMKLMSSLNYVVISDKGYMYDTQKTVPFYASYAKGGPFRGTERKVLTTRKDNRIGFSFEKNSWGPY